MTRRIVLASVVPVLAPVLLAVAAGPWSLLVGIPAAVVIWAVLGLPFRITVEDTTIAFDYLPFGLLRRAFNGRVVSLEVDGPSKCLHIELPERGGLLWHESISVMRLHDQELIDAMVSAGARVV